MKRFKIGDKAVMFQEVNDSTKNPKSPDEWAYTPQRWITKKTVLTIIKVYNEDYDYEVEDDDNSTYHVFDIELNPIYKTWKERLGGTK